mgnify:FL=1
MFPRLPFAGEADSFLSHSKNINTQNEVKCRKINRIYVTSSLKAGLKLTENGEFDIALDVADSMLLKAKSIGKELARTFLYNISRNPPESFLNGDQMDDALTATIESFCVEFSTRWLEKHDGGNSVARIHNTTDIIDFSNREQTVTATK